MYRFRYGLVWALLFGLPALAFAQGAIEGTVTEANSGEGIPGVNVILPSLSLGASTDLDGNYEISGIPAGTYPIEATFIGYRKGIQQVTVVDGQTVTIDFGLTQSALNLEEVVVTGSGGAIEKKKLGNTIGTIDMAALESAPVSSFSDVLQGREAGVVGLPSSGITGEGTRIRIRGSASLSQSNEPIVYIDGIRIDNSGGFGGLVTTGGGGSPSRLDDINPDAIARVEVLKGAAAATLYGTEASNGVIQIFTKQGTIGTPRFDFKVQQGFSAYPSVIPNNVGFARDQETADVMSQVYGFDIDPYELVGTEDNGDFNFSEELFETGYKQAYSGSISGGSPGISYFVSGRFYNEDGPFGAKEDDRYAADYYLEGTKTLVEDISRLAQLSASLSAVPSSDVRMRLSTYYTDRYLATYQNNNNIYGVGPLAMFGKPQFATLNNRTGSVAFATVNEALQETNDQNVKHFFGAFNAAYTAFEKGDTRLSLDGNVGFDVSNVISTEERPFGWNIDGFTGFDIAGDRFFTDINNSELTFDGRMLFDANPAGFETSLVAGFQTNISRLILETGSGAGFPGPGLGVVEAAEQTSVDEGISEIVNAGVFAQLQVGLTDWVYAYVGGRLDANSAFGSDFNAQFYPKIQAAIIPSDAPFWTGIGPVSSLKIGAAVGRSGLQPGAFDALTTFTSLGGAIVPSNLGNPDLKPEISTEYEFNLESGLFSDRVGLEATYWNRTVNDALYNKQFPVSGGFRAQQLVNIGEIQAQGLEFKLDAIVLNRGDLAINAFASAAYIYEEVTDLGGAPPIKVGGTYTRYRNYLVEGYAPGTNFGVQLLDVNDGFLPVDFNSDGSPDSEAEVLAYFAGEDFVANLPNTSGTGGVLLKDGSGGNQNIGGNANYFLGKPQPDWSGSFGLQIDLAGFSLNSLFEYRAGNYYINNLTDAFRQANPSIGRNLPESALVERDYVDPSSSPEVRLAALNDWLDENLALSPFMGVNTLKKGDFLRLRELGLTYNLPRTMVQNLGLRTAAFTVAGRNLLLFTGYDGIDPEVNAIGRGGSTSLLDQNFLDSVEAFGFPLPRQVLFTVRFGF